MKTKIAVLIISIIYCGYLLILLAANHYKSNILNPLNSEYHFKNGLLEKAIEIEPLKAEYHMRYGLQLLNTLPNDSLFARNQLLQAKVEFSRSIKLKPYNKQNSKICSFYLTWIKKQL